MIEIIDTQGQAFIRTLSGHDVQSASKTAWFRTENPLPDGWYWHKSEHLPVPRIVRVEHGFLFSPNASADFSGEWQGPINPEL